MQSVNVSDIAAFMKSFLSSTSFDYLNVVEVNISTFNNFHIDGKLNKDFFDSDNVPNESYSLWSSIRPVCYELIKGKTLPLKMQFVFKLPKEQTGKILEDNSISLSSDSVDFLINVRYENKEVTLISATCVNTFIMDKSYEEAWDRAFMALVSSFS